MALGGQGALERSCDRLAARPPLARGTNTHMLIDTELNGSRRRVDVRPDETLLEQRRERSGGTVPGPNAATDIDFEAIRAEAAAGAPRLWS